MILRVKKSRRIEFLPLSNKFIKIFMNIHRNKNMVNKRPNIHRILILNGK